MSKRVVLFTAEFPEVYGSRVVFEIVCLALSEQESKGCARIIFLDQDDKKIVFTDRRQGSVGSHPIELWIVGRNIVTYEKNIRTICQMLKRCGNMTFKKRSDHPHEKDAEDSIRVEREANHPDNDDVGNAVDLEQFQQRIRTQI